MKNGDILFIHYSFNLLDKSTYMAPFIRGALSLDGTKMYFNHCAAVIEINGVLHVVEAGYNLKTKRGEVFMRMVDEWLYERKPKSYEIITPDGVDIEMFKARLLFSIGLPYDFSNVLLHQPVKIIGEWFGKEIWIGPIYPDKCQCANLIAYALLQEKWYLFDPEGLYKFVTKHLNNGN
jgi:hypothetical protein